MTHITSSSSKSGYWLTMVNFVKSQIGAGLFAMGDAFRNSGLLVGCILTIFLGIVNTYSNHIIINSSIEVKERKKLSGDPTLAEIVELSLETGPECFRRWSSVARRMVKTFIVITQLGFCSVYFVFVSQTAQLIADKYDVNINVRYYIAIIFPIVVASCMIRTIKLLAPISLLSNVLMISGIIFTVAISAMNLPPISERRLISPLSGWPLFMATTIYAFEGISLVVPIRNEMKDPNKFVTPFGVLNVTMGFTIIIILSVGFIGYLKYGDNVLGSLTLNLPSNGLSEAVQIIVALGVLLTYALQFFVAADVVWKEIEDFYGTVKHPNVKFALLKTSLVLLTACLAAVVPHLSLFISLVGAVSSTCLALVFPPICDISLRSTHHGPKKKWFFQLFRYGMDALILIVAAIGFFLGTYCSLDEIITAFESNQD